MPAAPLSGLRVLDLTEGVAGPFCTRLLANFGAEVMKVERPRLGDPVRQRGPFFGDRPGPERSILFNYLNTNKRSVTLKLDSEFGQQAVRTAAGQTDVVVENFRPGELAARGIGPEDLRSLNDALVVTSIPMFEDGNRYADYRLTELNLYAMSGLMDLVGGPGRPPLKGGGYQGQYMSGAVAAALTLFAAYGAKTAGAGSWIETSSMEVCAKIWAHMRDYTVEERAAPTVPPDVRRERSNAVLPCADGHMTVTLYYFQMAALGELLGIPGLESDPRFESDSDLSAHNREIKAEIQRWLSTRTGAEAQREAQARHLLFTKVNSTRDISESEHLAARKFFRTVESEELGSFEYVGPPFRLGEASAYAPTAAPRLGEANLEFLSGRLGIPESELDERRVEGVI